MSTNLPSFRQMFDLSGKTHPDVEKAVEFCFNGLVNHEQAFASIGAKTATTPATASTTAVATGITAGQVSSIAISTVQELFNRVNNQIGTAYTVVNSDYLALVTTNNASAVAVTLGGSGTGVVEQFGCGVENIGAGVATLTPASGTINGAANLPLQQGQGTLLYFDGTNWWALTSQVGGTGTITGVTAGTGLSGGGTSGTVTLAIAPTAVTAGSYTSANITVNAEGQLTAAANGSGGYLTGTVTINCGGASSGTFSATGTVTGAAVGMCAVGSEAHGYPGIAQNIQNLLVGVQATNTVYAQITLPAVGGISWGTFTIAVVVFP